jgi:hypothetical protein
MFLNSIFNVQKIEKYFSNFNETKYILRLETAKYFKTFKFWKKNLNFRLLVNLKQKVL